MRAIWNGMITFGLVNIPVGLYPATEDNEIAMHLLHEKDGGRIKNQRVCTICGNIVEYEDLVKGYEYEKDKYVTITDEDLEKVKVEATENIVIEDFVLESEIDPMYFEKPYYLLPGNKSEAAYALLRDAMETAGKIGIARVVIRTRERLSALRPNGQLLMLDTMHFPDEIREIEAPTSTAKVGKREVDAAKMLIDAMTSKFDATKYHDTYKEAVEKMVHDKVEGKEVVHTVSESKPTEVIDLMKYLKDSLNARKAAKPGAAEEESPPKAAAKNR